MKAQTFPVTVDFTPSRDLIGERVAFTGCDQTFLVVGIDGDALILTGRRRLPIGVVRGAPPAYDMPIDTYVSTLPLEHREAISRARSGMPLDSIDGDLFLKVVYWLTWSPMSEDDKNGLTLELLAATNRAKSWGAAS